MVSGWWLSLPLVGNILVIMVNHDGYYMVNDGCIIIIIWLVVLPYPSETYEFVSWDDDIPNMNGKYN